MPGKIVTLVRFNDPMEAALARNQLAEAGIPVMLSGDTSGGLFAGMGGAFGTVHLEVAEENYERALDILEGRDEEKGEEPNDTSNAIKAPDTVVRKAVPEPEPEESDQIQATVPTRDSVPERSSKDADETDDVQLEWTADEFATRAWRAAVFGCLILPVLLHLYSVWLLIRLGTHTGELSSSGTRRMYGALLIDGVVLGGFFIFIRTMMRS